jgi:hypothetical protein
MTYQVEFILVVIDASYLVNLVVFEIIGTDARAFDNFGVRYHSRAKTTFSFSIRIFHYKVGTEQIATQQVTDEIN